MVEKETDTIKAILTFLNYKRIIAWRNQSGVLYLDKRAVRMSKAGVSDIIGCLPDGGRILCLEVKTKKGKLTEKQAEFLADISKQGGVAKVVRSVDDVKELLERVGA